MSPSSKKRAPAPTKKLPIVPIAIGVIAVAAILALVFAMLGGGDDKSDATKDGESAPVTVTGDTLPRFSSDAQNDSPGGPAPVLQGKNFAGEDVTIPADDGKAKAIFFVAHWCPHCQREIPNLAEWLQNNELPDNVEIAFVSTRVMESGTTANYPPSEWLAANGFAGYPTIADTKDDNPAYAAYGAGGLPYVVFLDADNNVVLRTAGELGDSSVYTDIFDALSKGETPQDPRG
jgi:thiol-disulfide isomerase/thioredoxin